MKLQKLMAIVSISSFMEMVIQGLIEPTETPMDEETLDQEFVLNSSLQVIAQDTATKELRKLDFSSGEKFLACPLDPESIQAGIVFKLKKYLPSEYNGDN